MKLRIVNQLIGICPYLCRNDAILQEFVVQCGFTINSNNQMKTAGYAPGELAQALDQHESTLTPTPLSGRLGTPAVRCPDMYL